MPASREEVIEMLKTAYSMELETVMNYIANSINLDGVRAEEIKKSLAADVTAELMHATQLANRIKTIDGLIPGSDPELKDEVVIYTAHHDHLGIGDQHQLRREL